MKGLSPLGLVKDHHVDRGPRASYVRHLLLTLGQQVLPISNRTIVPVLVEVVDDDFPATIPTIEKHEPIFVIGNEVLPT